MARLCIVASPDRVDGFRLAGAEIHPASSAELAGDIVRALMLSQDVGLIAVDADLYGALDERLRRQIDRCQRPVVVSIPAGRLPRGGESRSRYVAELIQRAIGFKMPVK